MTRASGNHGPETGHDPRCPVDRLESHLGDPSDPLGVLSYQRTLALDDAEEFPAAICAALDDWGLPAHYVPVEHGGLLRDYQEPVQLIRALARRDLTVAIAHGKTYLGAVCVWVSGTPDQAATLGARIMSGVPVSLGLTERAHGSDLLAGEVVAEPAPSGGYLLTGEKWLINNATRGSILSVLARTGSEGGARAFSVLLVDKRDLPDGSFHCLDKVRTHGIRGADISGIAFDRAPVPDSAVVGGVGRGIETVLKALQLTRTLCTGLSMGAADHALALAVGFAEERAVYGRPLIELPTARRVLTDAAADALAHEALSLVAVRAIHSLTAEASIAAAVSKYLVPTGTEALIARIGRFLGARSFLLDVFAQGRFQKLERDHRIVSLFDGNTLVNLTTLVTQFRGLARRYRKGIADLPGAVHAFDLGRRPAPLDASRLALTARGGSSLMASLPSLVDALHKTTGAAASLAPAAQRLLAVTEQVHAEMAEYRITGGDIPTEAFDLAKRYCLCFAAATSLGLWLHNRGAATDTGEHGLPHHDVRHDGPRPNNFRHHDLWRDDLWLRAVLDRLLARLGVPDTDSGAGDDLVELLRRRHAEGAPLSLLPPAAAT